MLDIWSIIFALIGGTITGLGLVMGAIWHVAQTYPLVSIAILAVILMLGVSYLYNMTQSQ